MKLIDLDRIVSSVVSYGLRALSYELSIAETAASLCRVARNMMVAAGYSAEQTEGVFDAVLTGDDAEVARQTACLIGGQVAMVIIAPTDRAVPMLGSVV